MSEQWPGGYVTKSPVVPTTSAAPGIWNISQQAAYQSIGLWPGIYVPDAKLNYVTMLLHGDGTNGTQNNTFVDSSSNTFSITRNGNTTQGSFGPHGSNWSNYFGTSATNLYNTSFALIGASTSTFTMEAWIFMNSAPVDIGESASHGSVITPDGVFNTTTVYMSFGPISNRKLLLQWFDGSAKTAYYDTPLNLNQWYHVAVVVNSNAISMYVNGTSVTLTGTTTLTNRSGTSNNFCVGGSGQYQFFGNVSNVRVTNTAVYTSNFTPSTTPLTAVSGTLLLTCQSNRFKDNSSNSYTLTTYGTPSVQRFNPFGTSTAYSTSTIGGSGYFDGVGDYLSVASNAAFAVGTGSFTIEAWIYCTSLVETYQGIVSLRVNTSPTYPGLGLTVLNSKLSCSILGNGTLTDSDNVPLNQWVHVAAVRSGTSFALFVNGVRKATETNSYSGIAGDIAIGRFYPDSDAYYFSGNISDARLVKGTAVYDPAASTLTVPTAPLTAVSGTSLLANMTNAAIYDNAMMNHFETMGNAQISTSVKKYGTGSLAFDGTGDYLRTLPSAGVFNTGDFTVEAWIYPSKTPIQSFVGLGPFDSNGWTFGTGYPSSGYLFWYRNGSAVLSATGVAQNTWQHVAVSRSGTTLRMFLDGVLVSSATDTVDYSATTLYVGNDSAGQSWQGYLDDLRITKGYARYTATFTPPTEAFQNIGP